MTRSFLITWPFFPDTPRAPIGFSLFRSKVGVGFPARSPAYRVGLYRLLAARRARSTALSVRAIT